MADEPRVLVVEDDETVRHVVAEALDDAGYAVRVAPDGRVALSLLEEWRPAVIILDLMMPVMDGRTFRAEQQARGLAPNVALIVLSASRHADGVGAELGAVAVVAKPFDLDMLVTTVDRVATSG